MFYSLIGTKKRKLQIVLEADFKQKTDSERKNGISKNEGCIGTITLFGEGGKGRS
jgi:hypothetical protein